MGRQELAKGPADRVLGLEEYIIGYFGLLRRGKKLYEAHKELFPELKRNFDRMDTEDALEYVQKSYYFIVEKSKKLYDVDVSLICAKLLRCDGVGFISEQNDAQGINVMQFNYVVRRDKEGRELALKLVKSILASGRFAEV